MPKKIEVWQRTTPDPGCSICPGCDGWGGKDWERLGKWFTCVDCRGEGQVIEQLAYELEKVKERECEWCHRPLSGHTKESYALCKQIFDRPMGMTD